MGNTDSTNNNSEGGAHYKPVNKFNPQIYLTEDNGLSRTDVLHIRHAFESLRDEEGAEYIRVARLKDLPIFTKQEIKELA